MNRFNPWVALLALLFNFLETWYFGWNLRPASPAEMVCDYISFAILIFAWIIPPPWRSNGEPWSCAGGE